MMPTPDSGGSGGTNTFTGGASTTGDRILTVNTTTTSFTTSPFTLGGNLTSSGTGNLILSGGLNLGASSRTLTGNAVNTTISGALSATNPAETLTLAGSKVTVGVVTGTANNPGIIVNDGGAGTGIFLFNGASTYGGATTLTSGNLQINTSSVVGGSGPIGFGAAATLSLNGGKLTTSGGTARSLLNPITLDADSQVGDATNNGTLNLNGPFTLDGNHQLTVNSTTNIGGVISGSPSSSTFTKLGAGTLTFGGGSVDTSANTYTGLTAVSAGNLALNKAAGTTAIAGDLTIDGTGTASLSANEQIANTASVTVNSSTSAAFSAGSRTETIANLTINGVTGVNAVTGGTGTLIIAGAGTITDNTGNIAVQNLTTGTGGLTIGSGVTVSSATTLNGDVTFNGATTGATVGAGAITLNGNRNFTVADATAASDLTVSGAISDGTVAGSNVTKLGAGTMSLTGSNSYTGTTTVSASGGTLEVANDGSTTHGRIASTATITVNWAAHCYLVAAAAPIESITPPEYLSPAGRSPGPDRQVKAWLPARPTAALLTPERAQPVSAH